MQWNHKLRFAFIWFCFIFYSKVTNNRNDCTIRLTQHSFSTISVNLVQSRLTQLNRTLSCSDATALQSANLLRSLLPAQFRGAMEPSGDPLAWNPRPEMSLEVCEEISCIQWVCASLVPGDDHQGLHWARSFGLHQADCWQQLPILVEESQTLLVPCLERLQQ